MNADAQKKAGAERRTALPVAWVTYTTEDSDADWNSRTINYSRAKLRSRAGIGIKPALVRFGAEIKAILNWRPAVGPLFPDLRTVRAGDRATEFKHRCQGLEILGVSLHSYRYAWAERALT
jgi:hypothetical protein